MKKTSKLQWSWKNNGEKRRISGRDFPNLFKVHDWNLMTCNCFLSKSYKAWRVKLPNKMIPKVRRGKSTPPLINQLTCCQTFSGDRITHPLGIFIVSVDVAAKRNEIACWIRFAGKRGYSLSLWSTTTAHKDAPNGKNLRFDDDAVLFNRKPSLGVTGSFRRVWDFLPTMWTWKTIDQTSTRFKTRWHSIN